MSETNNRTIEELGEPLFPLGQTVATPNSLAALEEVEVLPIEILYRHQCGDWGDLPEEDVASNKRALRVGARIFSRYKLNFDEPFYVITEWDRSITTILLASEY